jgi:hypothetical protein
MILRMVAAACSHDSRDCVAVMQAMIYCRVQQNEFVPFWTNGKYACSMFCIEAYEMPFFPKMEAN